MRLSGKFAAIVPSAAVLMLIGACSSALTDPLLSRKFEQQLHEIQPVPSAAEWSAVPAVTPENALAAAAATQPATRPATAQIPISLSDVRAAALANNLDLKVELFEPALARTAVTEEEARFESLFTISAQHDNNRFPSTNPTFAEVGAGKSDVIAPGIDVPLRSGGNVQLSVPMIHSDNSTGRLYQTGLQFSISQPLLRNAGLAVAETPIRIAQYEAQAANAQTRLSAIRILAAADRAYWELYGARRQLDVSREQYDLAVTQREQARKRVAIGASPQIEIVRAESGVAERLDDIITAQTQVRLSERELRRIMNRLDLPLSMDDTKTVQELVPTSQPRPLGLAIDVEALADYAVAQRMEMLEIELQLAIDALRIGLERNATLPLVTIDYTYAINGAGSHLGDAFSTAFDSASTQWAASVSAEIPIGDDAAKSRLRRALLQRVQRLATQQQRRVAIRQEVFDAIDRLQQNWKRILAARQETAAAGRTYEAERRQFELGTRNSTDVLDAAARLARAQSREVSALASYEIATVDIAFAMGTVLGEARVQWDARLSYTK